MHKKKPLTLMQRVDREVEIFREQTESRAKVAQRLYDSQDTETRGAIDAMAERIVSVSRGLLSVTPNGSKDAVVVTLSTDLIQKNAFYLATEIVRDLAMFDVRVANFRFDPKLCAQCGVPLSKTKKKVKA